MINIRPRVVISAHLKSRGLSNDSAGTTANYIPDQNKNAMIAVKFNSLTL